MGTHQQQESRTMGKVKSGKPVHLISVHRGDALHSNMEEGGGCSWGGEDHWELGWRIHAEHKGIKNGGNVTLQGLGNESYMHSNAEEGGGFSFGGDELEHGWILEKVEGESSDSKWLKWGDADPNVAWRVVKCEEPSDSSDSDCDED